RIERIVQVDDSAVSPLRSRQLLSILIPNGFEHPIGYDGVKPFLQRGIYSVCIRMGGHPDEAVPGVTQYQMGIKYQIRLILLEVGKEKIDGFFQSHGEKVDDPGPHLLCKFAVAPCLKL